MGVAVRISLLTCIHTSGFAANCLDLALPVKSCYILNSLIRLLESGVDPKDWVGLLSL